MPFGMDTALKRSSGFKKLKADLQGLAILNVVFHVTKYFNAYGV